MLKKPVDLVVAIDPSTGSKSAVGFSVFDPVTMKILDVQEFKAPKSEDVRKRIRALISQIIPKIKELEQSKKSYVIFCESTVMAGKGGESLQRFIGALMALVPNHVQFEHVSNMQIKAFVGGTGKADKEQVALGLFKFFGKNELISNLITASRWDALDSLAIGITGYQKYFKGPLGTK